MASAGTPRVAILGLGVMGRVFARRASGAGLDVIGWDRSSGTPPSQAVRAADVVVTIVYDGAAVIDVMQDALPAMKCGAVWLQMSTIGTQATERTIELAATRSDIGFLDAPVSGSQTVAERGQLVVFASGDSNALTAAKPFLDAVAGTVHWLGDAGQGTRVGLLFNAWIGILIENIAEVANLAQALGIAPRRFLDLVSDGQLVSTWALDKFTKIVESRTDDVEVPLRLAHKNVMLALSASADARPHLPILERIAGVWAEIVQTHGGNDITALYEHL